MAMQAALEEIMGVHTHDDVDADMHDIFYLLSSGPDSDGVSEPHAEALDSSTTQQDLSQQPGCTPEVFCLSGMIPVSCGISGLKIKQETPEAFGHIDVSESSRGCTSSSGGSDFTNTAAPVGSPIRAPSPSFFGSSMDVHLAPTAAGQGPYCQHVLPSLDSDPLPAATATVAASATLAVAQAALSESMPDHVLATTQSDSTDALYDIVQSKSCRSYGRSSVKKPPLSHSTIEKHRRDRINHLIEELGDMVPPLDARYRCEGADSAGLKRPKHAVLADVVARYRLLQAENDSLRRQLAIASLQPGGSGTGSGSSSASDSASGYGTGQPPQHRQSPPAVMQSTPTPARVVSASVPVAATTTSPTNAVSAAPDATASNPTAAATSPASIQSQCTLGPALQENAGAAPAATAATAATAAASVAASMPTPSVTPIGAGIAHSPAVAAAAVSSLLSHGAVSAPSCVQLQAALHFPLIKAAAAAAAAAVGTPVPGFMPIAVRGSSTAPASSGPCGLYGAAVTANGISASNGMSAPSTAMVPPLTAVMPPPPISITQPDAANPPADTVALPAPAPSHCMGGLSCPRECATPPIAVQPSVPHAIADAQNNAAATAPAVGHFPLTTSPSLDAPADVTDSSSTEIHVCRNNAAKCKLPTVTAAVATAAMPSSPTPGFGAPDALQVGLTPQGHLCSQYQPRRNPQRRASQSSPSLLPSHRPSSSIAPMPPSAAATGGDAAAATTSSWLVRVVCPPRKDLVPAACSALAEAGVNLRSARVTSAPGGRMALELEVSCEEGVHPRGMQVGHIQCAIHSALQASANSTAGSPEEGERDQDGEEDDGGAGAPGATAGVLGRPAASTRAICKKKRQRTWEGQLGHSGIH
ncbi:hypothetical protein VaNZ11_005752 [Volvox africanus]|uniref:BHLH domain-containing protein n=1 Tax=Volvox africanus TaxID=51714 RepID=A0ABQ5RZ55_9CHLO|nr:hypothetical protein VaNZ11_005752 [Volvox africanus]